MKETINNSKKIIIIAIIIILFLLIGTAFAYLTTTLSGEKEYLIRVESLNLTLNEGNKLTLEKIIPLEDEEGMKLDGFSFSLTNDGNKEVDYYIYLDDLDIGNEENRIEDYSLRYSLTRNNELFMTRNLSTMGSNPNRRVDFGTISSHETINYTLRIWINYNATSEEAGGKIFKGKLRVVSTQQVGENVSTVLLENIPKSNQYDDGIDTFITGADPNNYIWYSGKLWRAVSINNSTGTTKLVTEWNISAINYSSGNSSFKESYAEAWLNDTSVDGFLGNLRNYENFININSQWDATKDTTGLGSIERPNGTTIVTDAVGLLNIYEYQSSFKGTDYSTSYLNNELYFWTLTPYNKSDINYISQNGELLKYSASTYASGVRPSINLQNDIKIIAGNGTENDPYRLLGDNDELSETFLNTRYSGEYVSFGTGENNLYRIVSHETSGLTKIVSAEPLKGNGMFKTLAFGTSPIYSNTTVVGNFLNEEYLNDYLNNTYNNMISNDTIWYLGEVGDGTNYKLAKYIDENETTITSNNTIAKVGLLRLGELMSGQFSKYGMNTAYWTITLYNNNYLRFINYGSHAAYYSPSVGIYGIKPALNLKSNVIIIGGVGTKENPFQLAI